VFLCYVVATVALAVLVMVGWALTKLYGSRWPAESFDGNCWSFAIPKWLMNPSGTYLVVSLSRHVPVPHVRFAPSIAGLYVEELQPAAPRKGFRGILDSFWFRGKANKGQSE
jgi:hypothetical protein